MRDRQESIKEAIDVTKKVVDEIMESGPTLGAGAAVKVAGKIPKVLKAAKATKAAGQAAKAAKGGKVAKVLQSGGQRLNPKTLKAFNLSKEQGRNAIHSLKEGKNLPNDFHGKIMSNGDYLHPSTGEWLGNIFDHVY